MTTTRRTFTKWLGATAASTAFLGHARLAHAEPYKVGFVYVGPVEDFGYTHQHDVGRRDVEQALAGKVKTTPAAMDSPAEPVVWTTLFSRIVGRPNGGRYTPSLRRMLMESTEIGIDAETVSPARKPT